ncbi:uncharacterized protein SPSK_05021 [Sporothrix schenckii 1099-18]|uniref:Zn(2)-C6 fungal-type domain-containing protein n=2 Tax=Sporothrix schenckii TaxID=29908 RepID=U7Q6T5_SPOS1|nr:uncharacterized protein SPSK_05021 [Sporothrix schenckii 1099-18]ERT02421.1 hypothetical protein HMPREF1624_00719 [Sporothrix schenckii ATCC 58251]KJR80309.1 hypothetical protein SPSK_05021 [Sporothrix schenckii 1099-18]
MQVDPVDTVAVADVPRPTGRPRDVALRISQVVSACSFCKSRKIKCDGGVPACGCCTKFGRAGTCSLADGSARPAHDYVVFLQGRIADVKTRLAVLRPDGPSGPTGSVLPRARAEEPHAPSQTPFDFNASSEDLPAAGSPSIDAPQRRPRPRLPPQLLSGPAGSSGAAAIDTLIADIGALPISTSSHAHTSAASAEGRGPTLSTVLLAAASKLPLLSIVDPETGRASGGTAAAQASVASCLPDESAARKLIQHYIQQVYPRLPFFSLQGFWAQFQQVYGGHAHAGSSTGGSVSGSAADPTTNNANSTNSTNSSGPTLDAGYSYFTVLLVLAIATSSLSRSADSMISNQARRLFQAGLQFRESAILPNTIVGVQSLLFLIQFATLNPSVLDAWYLIGVGMRNCVDLGLHQDPDPDPDADRDPTVAATTPPSLLETRRRLWWSMYSFDRSLSIGCGRPTEIADALIHVRLPSFRIESTATAVEVEGYLQRYRALQLQSEIYDALSQPPTGDDGDDDGVASQNAAAVVDALARKLDAWQLSNRPERNRETLADSEWLVGKMLLFRPCRLLPERSVDALRELWVSARGFTALYRQLVETNGIFYVQVACEKVYWTGLVLLYAYWKLTCTLTPTPTPTRGERDDVHALHLWKTTKDIALILQTLGERWEDGKILAAQFDTVSARVIELLDGGAGTEDMDLARRMPPEVVTLSRYASLVSIWAAGAAHWHGGLGAAHSEELQDLVAKMI